MNNLIYIAIGVATTLYVKDKDFRNEVNKVANNIINDLKKEIKV